MTARAAVYARYSSDLQKPSSIEDQLRCCREYAAAHGLTVDDQHIYSDAELTGQTTARPGLQRLLTAVERKPRPFAVLLIDDSSRLSRNTGDALKLFEQLNFAGVRLIATSQGIDSDNAQSEVLMTVHGMVDSLYVRELGHKTHRGLEGLAQRGFSTGGRCYGYRSVQAADGVLWEVDEDQAVIVRRIFEMAAEGMSLKGIAKALNADRVPPPRPREGRIPSWCGNAIRAMLRNETYIGVKTWNQQKFVRGRNGKRVARPRPEQEWKRVESPALRIIEDELWDKVQRALAWKRKHFSRGGGMYGRVSNHLLTGLLRCAECGGLLTIVSGSHKAARYGCANYANRGTCTNDLRQSETDIQERLLQGLRDKVLGETDYALAEAERQVRDSFSDVTTRLYADRKRKAVLEAELQRLWAIAASGGDFDSLRGQITQRDAELSQISERLQAPAPGNLDAIFAKVRKAVMERLHDLPGLMNRDIPAARAWLTQYVGSITMTPMVSGRNRYYVAAGTWDVLGETALWANCGGALFTQSDKRPVIGIPFHFELAAAA